MDNNTKLIVIAIVAALVGVGAGYGIGMVMNSGDDATDYHFYLHFDADDERNGWYSGAASDATEGFDKAMNNADFEYTISGLGYIGSVDGFGQSWSIYDYIYNYTDAEAADASDIGYTVEYTNILNGWNSFAGYDVEEDEEGEEASFKKIKQSNSTIFFFSVYDDDWYAPSPADVSDWKNDGPFKA